MTNLGQRGAVIASRAWSVVKLHRRSLDALLLLLGVILLVDILTFTAGFGGNDDPGTYTAQAWAVLYKGELAHYTYWYDHPPLGWLQIALYAWVTDGFGRASIDTLMAGEFMVVAQLVSCALIFMLMPRLNFNRMFAALGVCLFALSPLAIQFQKMAFLDNLAVTWLLASMVFAVSRRRSLGSAFGAGVCLAIATLTKETSAIWVVVIVYMLWQNHSKGTRSWPLTIFFSTFVGIGSFYILYAILKGELFPGPGHVSLWDSLMWQLGRKGGYEQIYTWLGFDHFMLYLAVAAVPFGLFVRRLRPVTVGFVVMCLTLARGGYIPAPFIIGMLPFAAVLIAGVFGTLWSCKLRDAASAKQKTLVWGRNLLAGALVMVAIVMVAPSWTQGVRDRIPRDEVWYYQQTIAWVQQNVPHDAVIAVDDNMWVDLRELGYTNVVWFYKFDLDPAIQKEYTPPGVGYRGIDYVVLKDFYWSIADDVDNSLVIQARDHGQQVATFGNTNMATGSIVDPYDVVKVG